MSDNTLTVDHGGGRIVTVYKPLPHQEKFHAATIPNLASIGGRGSGKSKMLRMDAMMRCLRLPGYRALILRREMPELRRTHIAEIPMELHQLGGDAVGTFRQTTSQVFFVNGSVLEFGHAEQPADVYKYLSAEYNFIGFDELASFELDMFLQISASARSTKGGGYTAIVRAGTNPLGPGAGWIKEWFVDKDVDRDEFPFYDPSKFDHIHSTFRDNTHLAQSEYQARLQALAPHQRKAWLDGEFNDEQAMFDFRPTKDGKPYHVVNEMPTFDNKPIIEQPWVRIYASIDHGFWPDPTVCLWYAVFGRRVLVFREQLWYRTIAKDVAKEIAAESRKFQLVTVYCDPSMDIRTGADVVTIKETYEANGVPMTCSVNNREHLAHAIHTALQEEAEPGVPRLQILRPGGAGGPANGAGYLIKTLPLMRYDEKHSLRMADHRQDHAVVALGYYLLSHIPSTAPTSSRQRPKWMTPLRGMRDVLGRHQVRTPR